MKKIVFLAAVILLSLAPSYCFASREDIALSQDYQLESEKNIFKDKFSWGIDFTYGLSSVSSLLGLGANRFSEKPSEEYLDTLGMSYSTSDFSLALGASYLVTPRLELSVGLPLSVVMAEVENSGRRKVKHPQLKFGVGDVYGGISYALLAESKSRPLVVATFEAKSALSKYTFMGDGFVGLTPGVYLRKFISGPVYALGLAGYTFRLKRRGADPEENIRYGGGFGILSENKRLEFSLGWSQTGKTKIGDRTIMDSEEDLTLGIDFTTIFGGQTSTIGLSLSGLEDGLDWGKNTAGLFIGFTF